MRQSKFYLLFLSCFLCYGVHAQRTVTGSVIDEDGDQLIGVNIVIQGTAIGTTTDIDGTYSISVPDENAVLEFTYIGYATRSISVGSDNVIDVILALDAEVLQEVVVSALGFKERKDEMGSTFSTVNPDDITRSGEAMLLNSLGAKASNVQISRTNGDPGAGTIIRIRGANTISGSSNPLIILDGVPISNSTIYGGGNDITGGRTGGTSQQSRLNDINPNDIESVQILKGASAAALWGSRAANGVVVITTKDGNAGEPKISFKSTLSFDEVHERYPMQTVYGQGRSGSYGATRPEAWGDYIPDRSGGADVVDQSGEVFIADDGTEYYPIDHRNSKVNYVDSNWDAVFQTGSFWQNDLSISGGTDRATYFFSLGRLDQDGIIRNSDYDRTNIRLNNRFILNDWLSLATKAGYTNSNSNRIQQSSNTAGLLLGLLRTPPDFDISDYKGTYIDGDGEVFPERHRAYRRYLGQNSNPIYNNPLWTIFEQTAESALNRFLVSAELNITPTQWLQFTLRGGVDNYEDKRVYHFPIGSAGDRNPGIFNEDLIGEKQVNFSAIGKANFDLTSAISLTATAGWNINDQQRRVNTAEIEGFLVNSKKQTSDLNTAKENSSVENSKRFIRSNRGFGILDFDLYDQLFVSLSGALEAASSVKGTFFYPAVDAAWQFTRTVVNPTDAFSFGKIRGSWGKVGVQPLAHRFQTLSESGFTYSTYSDPLGISFFGGGFRLDDDRGNPNLEPEIKTEWEVGLDLRFLQDNLSLSMTYYQNKIKGLLFGVELTPSSGFDTEYTNAGSMENTGFELETDYAIIRRGDFDVSLYGNWSTNDNTVTDLKGTETIDLTPGASVSSRAIQGFPLGVLYGTGSQTDANGNFILDENGFPKLTLSPHVLGDPNPDWRAGFGVRASWKSLSLNILFEHSHGADFSPRTQWVLRRFGTTEETTGRLTLSQDLTNFAGDLIPAGTTVRGNIDDFGAGPVLLDETWYRTGIGGGFGDNQAYNFSIADATFTRFKELSISYVLDTPGLLSKTKLSSIILTATGRNLFLWDDLKGVDPEVNQVGVDNGFGLDYFTNPSTRSFLFSLIVNY
ncbi:MAG: SusC/RagA family TonB-linked outer membrane protein [Saprospiraceae bacterium]|nr:SusC/RagA family TonB-linked outer membrane protein [Saprospiraceae bacterium]